MQLINIVLQVLLTVVGAQQLQYLNSSRVDCSSDVAPPGLGKGCWDLEREGKCSEKWFLEGEFCIKTCDFCGQKNSSLNVLVSRSFSALPIAFEETVFVDLKSRTLRGCTCPTWKYNETVYTGCGNPDKSPLGGWCPVNAEDCPLDPLYTSKVPISVVFDFGDGFTDEVKLGGSSEYSIDSCTCLPDIMCGRTIGGCRCKSSCVNIDYDLNGPWCFVEEESCPYGFQSQKGGTEATDYCRPGCCPN
eukprot:TRINITY_DN2380_c0_g1_i4.p2 TRINITY_DN2380_c0_g1~~TRINITY_DN2380_c0_g1_i4.p2  ORF type:complete len:271 (+),score=30.20 TRINITY_DN2380_c0_g1_i4:78-815(+)